MDGINLKELKINKNNVPKKTNNETSLFDFLNKDIALFESGFNDKKKEALYLELSILISAGVDIKSALEIIVSEQEKKQDKALFEEITEKVIQGSALSTCLKESKKFSSYEYYSIQIGEETGRMSDILIELSKFYKNKIKQRRQLVNALSYPALVLFTSFGAIFFMMNFVVPMFADIFKRFGGELPWITKVILSMSHTISATFLPTIVSVVGLGYFLYVKKDTVWFRKYSCKILLKMPILGKTFQKIYLARLCQSMELLTAARIPLVRAISLVRQMIGFYPIEISLLAIEKDIMQGMPLHKSMSQFDIYPPRMVSLIKVGEEVNRLELFFNKVGTQYTEEVEHQTALISTLLEPFLIIFLGLVVGTILIAMYLPLFQLGNSFN